MARRPVGRLRERFDVRDGHIGGCGRRSRAILQLIEECIGDPAAAGERAARDRRDVRRARGGREVLGESRRAEHNTDSEHDE